MAPVLAGAQQYGIFRKSKELLAWYKSDTFEYAPLPTPTCTRLLEVRPGMPGDMIELEMRIVDLDHGPRYNALSYSWERDPFWSPAIHEGLNMATAVAKDVARTKMSMLKKRFGRMDDGSGGDTKASSSQRHEFERRVRCNGKTLAVLPNLYHALLQLRQSRPGTYWIDALCINQRDSKEVGNQIQMMGRIYESAERVVVWLGKLPTIEFEANWPKYLEFISTSSNLTDKRHIDFDSLDHGWRILGRRWFGRLWVLQEACLARDIVFLMGEYEITEFMLRNAVKSVADIEGYGPLLNVIKPVWGGHIECVPELLDSRRYFMQGGKWHIDQWLNATKGRRATKLVDFVYSGLGLIRPEDLLIDTTLLEKDTLPPPLPVRPGAVGKAPAASSTRTVQLWPKLYPNIGADPAEVFLNLSACLLSRPQGIDKLLSTGYRYYSPDPVWQTMVDYSDELKGSPSWMVNPTTGVSKVAKPLRSLAMGTPKYAACSAFPSDPKISADGITLHLEIIRLDEVRETIICGPVSLTGTGATLIQDCLLGLPTVYDPTGEDMLKVYATVLTGGLWSVAYPSLDVSVAFRAWLRSESDIGLRNTVSLSTEEADSFTLTEEQLAIDREARKNSYSQVSARFPHHDWLPFEAPASQEETQLQSQFGTLLHRVMTWRQIFITKKGMLGLAPLWMDNNDTMALVKGAAMPYIFTHIDEELRRNIGFQQWKVNEKSKPGSEALNRLRTLEREVGKRDAWRLVGEAYVEGVMMGEAATPAKFQRIDVI